MNNKKLPLHELKIKSFITTIDGHRIRSGALSEYDDSSTSSDPTTTDPTDGSTCFPPASQNCNNYSALPCYTQGIINCNSVSPACGSNMIP